MEESILTSVKKMLGIPEEYTHFDIDLIIHINTVLRIINQMGVGNDGFSISDSSSVWSDFLGDDTKFDLVKSYVYLKVKMIFDTPQSSAMIEALNKTISELEWRISILENKFE